MWSSLGNDEVTIVDPNHTTEVPPVGSSWSRPEPLWLPHGYDERHATDQGNAWLRNQVVDICTRLSKIHAHEAYEAMKHRPYAPHAIQLYFFDSGNVRVATRMFLDDERFRHLPGLLYGLAERARIRYLEFAQRKRRFEPHIQMCNVTDSMSRSARYVGIGVSTLDTPKGSWENVYAEVESGFGVPGRCFIRLQDSTLMLIDRPAMNSADAGRTASTGTLQMLTAGAGLRYWTWGNDILYDPRTMDIWKGLDEYHCTISKIYNLNAEGTYRGRR